MRLIQDLEAMPNGRLTDLNTHRMDHESLSNLSAHLGILANILAQQQAARQELATQFPEADST